MPSAVLQATEGHLDPHADLDAVGIDVGQLERQPAATVEVDDREHHRWARRIGQAVDGVGDDGAEDVGHRNGVHVVDLVVLGRDARGRQVDEPRLAVARTDEAVLPIFAAGRGRRRGARRFGPTRRLDA